MPVRATKRGAQRTPLNDDCDVIICGASFAGLAVARELSGSGARVMMLDRYEVGERQTSACAAPTAWLEALSLESTVLQTFGELVVNTPGHAIRYRLPWTFSTFDYAGLCERLRDQSPGVSFETAKVEGIERGSAAPEKGRGSRSAHTVRTDRGDLSAPLVVDALGWRRILGVGDHVQPPEARLSRGLEVHPPGSSEDLEIWIDPTYVRAGYGWSFPAGDELRVGIGSFEPRDRVKDSTVRLAGDRGLEPEGFQGNWIPHQLRPATEAGVFFVGDSAGHCLPLTAEGIRTALYFGLACGRELRAVVEGGQHRETALERYAAFSAQHHFQFASLLKIQHVVGRVGRRPGMSRALHAVNRQRFVDWAFRAYFDVTPPSFVDAGPRPVRFARAGPELAGPLAASAAW